MKVVSRPLRTGRHIAVPLALLLLCVLLLLSLLLGVSFGATVIPLETILAIVLNKSGLFHFTTHWDRSIETIIWQLRMPAAIAAALVGAALAVAGALFQGLLRNPLADPFLIGTSSGAALGATISFILPSSLLFFLPLTPLLAFVGAILSVLFVYALARTGGQTPVVTLLLAGVVINAVLEACQILLLMLWPPAQGVGFQGLFSWLAGNVSLVSWSSLLVIMGIVLCGILLACGFSGVLDVFSLGEERASFLGLHVELYKFLVVMLASLLTAAAVSISGLIGFVGLVTPHLLRLLLGPRHRLLIPASALAGASFLVLADLLARVVLAPSVLPVGVFTACIGAPFFLFLLRTRKREYRW